MFEMVDDAPISRQEFEDDNMFEFDEENTANHPMPVSMTEIGPPKGKFAHQ